VNGSYKRSSLIQYGNNYSRNTFIAPWPADYRVMSMKAQKRCHDIQHNDTQHNGMQYCSAEGHGATENHFYLCIWSTTVRLDCLSQRILTEEESSVQLASLY